jgi:eukaryotic-like serine/threonine-protein kinase
MAVGPQTLGRYQLERVLGKGAMGIVYEALDPKLHRKVAIKTILISQLDEETAKDFSMRFVREAHAVARLNHPNIVQVYDFGEEGDIAYLVMEFIRGDELKSTLSTGRQFDRKECVRIMSELLDALDFAHEAGVVHRDIKPANVMLDSQGRTKLTDFGVARVTDSDRTHAERTQAGTVVGTPAYMSPEQIQGQSIDRRTDIFSAGVILYQFLTGQKPFTGEGAWTVAKKIIQEDPPMPSSINVALSPEFDRVVAKALAKDPGQRFATAREFSQALKRAAEGKPAIPEEEATLVVPRVQQPTHAPEALRSGEMELEFWRSIKDSDDANDFELYVRQFPQGVYASLAARKAAKLRSGSPADDSGTRTMAGADRTRVQRSAPRPEAGESAQAAVEKTIKLADAPSQEPARAGRSRSLLVPAVLAVLVAAGAVTYFVVVRPGQQSTAEKVEAEAKAKRDAEAAKAEAQARRDAEAKADQAKRDAEAQAKREAEAQAQREAESQAKRSAEAKAKREAEGQTKREAELRAKREADVQAKRQAEMQAKRESEERAQREAKVQAQRDAENKAKLAAETSLWDSVKASRKTSDIQKYLNRYPNGQYAEAARQRVLELENPRLEEAAKKQKDGEKKKPTIIVPPTF